MDPLILRVTERIGFRICACMGVGFGSLRDTEETFFTVDEELEMVEKGCAHTEKSNRTMSYRMGSEIISLTETVCGSNLCNKPTRSE